jgi:hypothetical protein
MVIYICVVEGVVRPVPSLLVTWSLRGNRLL